MSRVGKQPITIPDKVKVEIDGKHIKVTGPQGSLERTIHPDIVAALEENQVVVTRSSDLKKYRALHGLTRALLHNMVEGVSQGYKKELQLVGVGYRSEMKGEMLVLHLGYSHPTIFIPPDGIKFTNLPKESKIIVEGIDKELVGEVAAKIRSLRKPEPYKGKGIRYVGEHVRSKAGKAAGGA
ncbi:MAG TPA: 50S ribosomal protein L6 [candidate division Zixibacteria bacterium]|nr:50S ribosomal protein L6 [candidate division Zixibacteria bacterium]